MALPSGYTRLAYIESTGTQYINVGFIPNNNTKAVCDAELLSGTNDISVPFGTYESGSNRFALMYHHQLGWTHWVGGASGQCAGEQLGRHTFTLTGTSLVVDSATKTFTTAAFTGSVPMFLFGINYQGSLDYAASMRLYSCRIYDNGTLVRDFVPCKNASGVVGLYDLKNGAFYSNAGTGTFSYGEVEPTGDHSTMVDGVIWGIPSGRCLVGGVGYSIQKGRTMVDGVGYDVAFAPPSIPVSDLAVGESVYANVGGVRTEFLIVHKGKPDSSYYDASCDGIWLLMKNVYTTITNTITGNYSESTLHSYLNGTFLDLLDADVANAIKTVKIPYNTGIYTSIQTGSNGLSTKAFALSLYEVGFTSSMNTDFVDRAACLSYFTGTAYTDSKRIGYLNGVATDYALRTTYRASTSYLWGVSKTGIYATLAKNKSHGVRPAFILDIDTPIHAETFDILV